MEPLNMLHKLKSLMTTLSIALLLSACAATPGKVSVTKAIAPINVPDAVAVHGYDPVAYFTDGAPTAGSPSIQYEWSGVHWQFASEAHRSLFVSHPEQYAPQYGGYCAFAVSRGTVADGDPHQWAIVNNKLYLNNNAFAMHLWDKDRPGNIQTADINWPLIPKKHIENK
jgi:YHS domain-containing protein